MRSTREQVYLIFFQILIFTIKESGLGGDRASSGIIAAFKKAAARTRYRKADKVSTSMQTERSAKADVSTQTGDNDNGAVEEVAPMKTSASDRDSRIGFANCVPEDAADDQTAAAISEETMFLEDSVFEGIVLRAEQAHVSDRSGMNKTLDGTEPQRESKLRESITESDFHDLYSGLPKVVADCVRAVFSAVVEFPRFATVTPSEPHGEEVNTEEWSEGAEDLLIEIGPRNWSPEVGEVFCVPLQVYLPVMENIEKAFWEELECQEELIDDVFLPDMTEPVVLDEVDANRDEVAAAGALTFQGLPQWATVGKVSTEPIVIEGLPEDVMTKLGLETVQEAQPSGFTVQNHAADALQAAMEALSRELSAIVSLETEEVEFNEAMKEDETIGAAFQPLSGRPDANLFISEVPHVFVFDEEMLVLPMNLIENEKITNEELPRNDMGSHDVKTTAEFISRTDVNTEAAGLETFEETEPSQAMVKSNAEEETEAPPHDLCSTSTSEWEADTATQLEEQENVSVFESVSEYWEANHNLTQFQESENSSRILNLSMSSSGNPVEETNPSPSPTAVRALSLDPIAICTSEFKGK